MSYFITQGVKMFSNFGQNSSLLEQSPFQQFLLLVDLNQSVTKKIEDNAPFEENFYL